MPIQAKRTKTSERMAFIDGFEDGDYTSNPTWTYSYTGNPKSVTVAVNSTAKKNGSYGLQMTYTSSANWADSITLTTNSSQPTSTTDYTVWVYISNGDNICVRYVFLDSSNNPLFYEGIQGFGTGDPRRWQVARKSGGSFLEEWPNSYRVPSAPAWYQFKITYNPSSNLISFYVYDSGGSLLQSYTDKSIDSITIAKCKLLLAIGETYTRTAYWDDVSYMGLRKSVRKKLLTAKR